MAKVIVPTQIEGYYNSTSSRCRPPQQSCHTSFDTTHPRAIFDRYDQYSSLSSNQSLSPPGSSGTVSPQPTEIVDSFLSSPVSSPASSIDLAENQSLNVDMDETLFFPVYEYKSTPSPQYNTLNPANSNTAEYNEYQERNQLHHTINALPMVELLLVGPADDNFIKEEPSRHVDYLSHDWKEEDIWASWRYMIGKRKEHSNAARLENASWRTWAKAKYQLKTVSPEKLNWLKDCDVTWLYGPLSTGAGKFSSISPVSPPVSPIEPKVLQTTSSYKTKPILKKRSMSEVMLQRSLTTSSLLKQATASIESQQLDTLKSPLRHSVTSRANSDITASTIGSVTTITASSEIKSGLSTRCDSPLSRRHIHFNDQVQQCIAVDMEEDEGYDVDDEDEFICNGLFKSSSSCIKQDRGSSECQELAEPLTIAMLPSTTLKHVEDIPLKKSRSFITFNSFFSGTRTSTTSVVASSSLTQQFEKSSFLPDDDDDFSGLNWTPKQSLSRSSSRISLISTELHDDSEIPNYSYEEEEDPSTEGLLGRAVDAVNTARDIAHVLWNVGWRR